MVAEMAGLMGVDDLKFVLSKFIEETIVISFGGNLCNFRESKSFQSGLNLVWLITTIMELK